MVDPLTTKNNLTILTAFTTAGIALSYLVTETSNPNEALKSVVLRAIPRIAIFCGYIDLVLHLAPKYRLVYCIIYLVSRQEVAGGPFLSG